jgi:hypothetical protein
LQQNPFGRRSDLPQPDAIGSRDVSSASPEITFPISIEKDIGPKATTLFGSFLGAAVLTTLPGLLDRAAWTDVLLHSTHTYINLGLLMLAPAIYLLGRNRGELDISAQGIRVATKSGRWSYAWADIEDVEATQQGAKLLLKGRSDEQNGYNIIPSGFGLKPPELCSIVRKGISRFGAAGPSMKTSAPADDLQSTRAGSIKQSLKVFGLILGGVFTAIVVWQALDCMKSLELQKSGRATEASVIRIYTSSCGKSGCSLNVEYSFTPLSAQGVAQIVYRGYEYIGSSRQPNDPNLIYARTNRTVPIVYDVDNPETSKLNFGNRVFAKDPVAEMLTFVGIFGGILGLGALIFLGCMTPAILRARRAE